MYESEPQEGGNPCMCDGRVIRKDYELMNMYHFSSDKSCGGREPGYLVWFVPGTNCCMLLGFCPKQPAGGQRSLLKYCLLSLCSSPSSPALQGACAPTPSLPSPTYLICNLCMGFSHVDVGALEGTSLTGSVTLVTTTNATLGRFTEKGHHGHWEPEVEASSYLIERTQLRL